MEAFSYVNVCNSVYTALYTVLIYINTVFIVVL